MIMGLTVLISRNKGIGRASVAPSPVGLLPKQDFVCDR